MTRDGLIGADAPLAWYACYTHPHHEKKVLQILLQNGVEGFLPVMLRTSQWHDRRKIIETPLFPSYVFARCSTEGLDSVLRISGVADVVRFAGRPATIRDDEMDNIARFTRALSETGRDPARVPFRDGRTVRIDDGPYQGVEGIIEEEAQSVLIGLRALGVGFEVDVPAASLTVLH